MLKWVDALIIDPALLLLAQTAGDGSKTVVHPTRDRFHGRPFFHGLGVGMVSG